MHICRLKVSLSVRLNIIHMYVYVICIWQVYSNIVRFICGMKRESSDVSLLTLKRLSIHTVPKFGNFSFNKPFVITFSQVAEHCCTRVQKSGNPELCIICLLVPATLSLDEELHTETETAAQLLDVWWRCYRTVSIIYLLNNIWVSLIIVYGSHTSSSSNIRAALSMELFPADGITKIKIDKNMWK